MVDENRTGIFRLPYVTKDQVLALTDENCYIRQKQIIDNVIRQGLKDAYSVRSIFAQFAPLINGDLTNRSKAFLTDDKKEEEFDSILKELRFFEILCR